MTTQGKRIAYIRVSTQEQNTESQILKQHNIDKFFEEKVSGKNANRPKLLEMLDYVREGDIVFIKDFSRLARSTQDLLRIIEKLKNKNVKLISIKEQLDTSTPSGKLMVTMLGVVKLPRKKRVNY